MKITIDGKAYFMNSHQNPNGTYSWLLDEFFITGDFNDRSSWHVEETDGELDDWGMETVVATYAGNDAIRLIQRLARRYRVCGLLAKSPSSGEFLTFGMER